MIIFYLFLSLFFFTCFYLLFSSQGINNLLKLLFIIELLALNFSIMFLFVDYYYYGLFVTNLHANGQIFVLFLLTISALEASIGLAFIYYYFRFWRNINIQNINKLKT